MVDASRRDHQRGDLAKARHTSWLGACVEPPPTSAGLRSRALLLVGINLFDSWQLGNITVGQMKLHRLSLRIVQTHREVDRTFLAIKPQVFEDALHATEGDKGSSRPSQHPLACHGRLQNYAAGLEMRCPSGACLKLGRAIPSGVIGS
jgi:hypothetical protein